MSKGMFEEYNGRLQTIGETEAKVRLKAAAVWFKSKEYKEACRVAEEMSMVVYGDKSSITLGRDGYGRSDGLPESCERVIKSRVSALRLPYRGYITSDTMSRSICESLESSPDWTNKGALAVLDEARAAFTELCGQQDKLLLELALGKNSEDIFEVLAKYGVS